MEPIPISIDDAVAGLTFLPDRSPTSHGDDRGGAFAQLATYRDSGVFVGHWAGRSEWERHGAGDEIVMVISGSTTIFFRDGAHDRPATLGAGQMVIVPQDVWHRFETDHAVTVLSITPQPTEHTAVLPS